MSVSGHLIVITELPVFKDVNFTVLPLFDALATVAVPLVSDEIVAPPAQVTVSVFSPGNAVLPCVTVVPLSSITVLPAAGVIEHSNLPVAGT